MLLIAVVAALAIMAAVSGALQHSTDAQAQTVKADTSASWYQLGFLPIEWWDMDLVYFMGGSYMQSADIGEVLETGRRISQTDMNPNAWSDEWYKTAERIRRVGITALEKGHRISAGEAFLRAASYYRAFCDFYPGYPSTPADDPLLLEVAKRHQRCFNKALRLQKMPVRIVRIPYGNTTMPGYFFRSSVAGKKAPVLIVHQGKDGWAADDLYIAQAAIERGYHCLLFDGPGQGASLRIDGTRLRPDWEKAVTPAVNWVVKRRGVDKKRIALYGLSMGGYFAPRAAAFDKRIKIVIANPGSFDWGSFVRYVALGGNAELEELLETDPAAFDAQTEAILAGLDPYLRWQCEDLMWKIGTTSLSEAIHILDKFTLADCVHRIKARVLVLNGEDDDLGMQAEALYEALTCPKDYINFDRASTAETHCQQGASAISTAAIFDWLDENINRR